MAQITDFLNRDEKAFVEFGSNRISNHYGLQNQLLKLVEECSEFTQAFAKHTFKPTVQNFDHLLEELADVSLVTAEVLNCLSEGDSRRVAEKVSFKISRELNRIEKA